MNFKNGDTVTFSQSHIKGVFGGLFDSVYEEMFTEIYHKSFIISIDETRYSEFRYRLIGFENKYDWHWQDEELELVNNDIFNEEDFLL